MVDSCLHRKFRNGAWRPRAAFKDRVLSFEDRIIYIDLGLIIHLPAHVEHINEYTLHVMFLAGPIKPRFVSMGYVRISIKSQLCKG